MTARKKTYADLRSSRWYGAEDLRAFGHRSRTLQMGYAREDWEGKPVIGIINTWSEMNPCHVHFRARAEEVKRGVWQAGGFPVEMPAMSLGEPFMKPTTMLYRNLLAMETEELLRANPIDGAVLLGGCDKTTPAMLMGAFSMNIPAIFVPAGPMLRGYWGGATLGSGSDSWKYWAELRAGNITEEDWRGVEEGIARSFGTCMTMGTASTMACVTEALGMTLPGAASIPYADSNHPRLASESGRRIVDMVWGDLKPRDILTSASFDNAVTILNAIGGSTNAIIHLVAMAGRCGLELPLTRFDEISKRTPLLVNLRPSGEYLMEDFHYAGGSRAVLQTLSEHLDLTCKTVTGRSLGQDVASAKVVNSDVIRSVSAPLKPEGGLSILHGNLAPNGAVIKHSVADPNLLQHTGSAVVFDDYNDMAARIDDPDLEVDADSVLVLRNAGPIGGAGMPEWGMLPVPKKLLQQGVRDMVRLSDARMSGTSYGTCVLHVAPESAVGGPLALIRSGDSIRLDLSERKIEVLLDDAELDRRRAEWKAPQPKYARGYGEVFLRSITQADRGCDFDFLEGVTPTEEPEIH